MANPIDFGQANFSWFGPGDIAPLPVHRDDEGTNISCWELSAQEYIEVLQTGKIWLTVWGDHPAVNITGQDPFVEGE